MLRLHDSAAFLTDYSLRDGKPHLLDAPVSGGVVAAGTPCKQIVNSVAALHAVCPAWNGSNAAL